MTVAVQTFSGSLTYFLRENRGTADLEIQVRRCFKCDCHLFIRI